MNDHTLDASVRVDLNGNVKQNAKRIEQTLNSMSRNGSRHLGKLQRTTSSLDRTMSRLGNRWIGLATGGSIVSAGKKVLDYDAVLTRLQTTTQMTDAQAAKFKQTLQSVANDKDIRVPIDELTSAVEQFLDKTGNVDYAIDNMRNFGLMMQGLGVEARSTGLLLAQFYEKNVSAPKEVLGVMDRLFAQFSEGSVSVNDIARVSAELFSIVQSKGPSAIIEIGGLAQVFAKTAGNADKSMTSLKATVRAFNDVKKSADIDEALARNGLAPIREASGLLRSAPQLLLDIIKVADSSVPELSKVFDSEALDGLKSLTDPKNRAQLDRALNGAIQQNLTLLASQKNAATASAALDSLFNAGRRFADLNLSGPIKDLADSVNDLSDEELVNMMETAKDVALAVGGIILSIKAMNVGANLLAKGHALGNKGGALGGAVSGMTPIPVFVVNNMTGGDITGAGTKDGKGAKAGKVGKIAKLGSLAMLGGGAGLALAGAGAAGYYTGKAAYPFIEDYAFPKWLGSIPHHLMASFGNEESQRFIVNSGDAHPIYDRHYAGYDEYQAQQKLEQQRMTVELELSPAASKLLTAKETKTHTDNTIDLEVSGSMGAR